MGPVGTAGYVLVAALAVEAVIIGALAGAILWAVGARLVWGSPVAAGAFLVATVLLDSYRLEPAAGYGIPLVMLTFLTAWLIARYVERRFLWLLQSRLGLWTPVATALVADVCLIAFLFVHRSRKAIAQ